MAGNNDLSYKAARYILADTVQPPSNHPDSKIVVDALKITLEKLSTVPHIHRRFTASLQVTAVPPNNGEILTPPEIASIDKVLLNDSCALPIPVQSDWYQFHENGLGAFANTPAKTVMRGGFSPCKYLPENTIISINSVQLEVGPLIIETDDTLNFVDLSTLPATLTLDSPITSIQKPVTINDIQIDDITNPLEIVPVITLKPATTIPRFQRYLFRLDPAASQIQSILALCNRRFVQPINDDDLVYPTNLAALRYAMLAYNYEKKDDLERASAYWNQAVVTLQNELQLVEGFATIKTLQMQGVEFVKIPSLSGI